MDSKKKKPEIIRETPQTYDDYANLDDILTDRAYELAEIYTEDDIVTSERVACASFTMADIMNQIPKLQRGGSG